MLMMNIQFNQLLKDEEAECGVSSTEDLEAEEDDGSISALIRSRWAKRASTNSISCCATDLISNSNRRPRSRNMSYDAEERQGREWAVGVEN